MLNLQKLETVEIPLNKLTLWDDNVRTSGAEDNLGELVASIRSVGLLQSLVVKKASRGTFVIGAGKRRFLALSQLAEHGDVKRSYLVPCRIAPDEADLTEISLAENVVRNEMGLRMQVAAFRRLVEDGKSISDIAFRFGLTDRIVERRLALARLSPVLWDAYDNGEITVESLQAFTLSSDQEVQDRVWNELPDWDRNKPTAIRRILANQDIPASDRTVRFVGLEHYEKAGGSVRRDLFSEGEDGAFICDAALLSRLASEKLEAIAAQAKQDGWKWVDVQPVLDHQTLGQFRRLQPIAEPLPKKDAAKLERLESQRAKLQEQAESDPEADENALYDQIEALQEQIEEIENNRPVTFDADTKAKSGAIVTIGQDGELQLVSGLLSKADAAALAPSGTAVEEEIPESSPSSQPQSTAYSASLVETLTVNKTAAIAAELSQQPNVALATVVHAFVLSQLGLDLRLYRSRTSIQIQSTRPHLDQAVDSKAGQSLGAQQTAWLQRLPKDGDRLWKWCLTQEQPTLLALLAFCAAMSLNAIETKNDEGKERRAHADAVATALGLDMTRWFTPTADNFFSRISKTAIFNAMNEAGKAADAQAAANLKKRPLAEVAERSLAGTGWLPAPLRILPRQTQAQEEDSGSNEEQQEATNEHE